MKGKTTMILLCLVLIIGIAISCRADVRTEYAEYRVKTGDTLWTIADEHMPRGTDKRRYIFELKKHNGLKTSEIYPGMILEIVRESK